MSEWIEWKGGARPVHRREGVDIKFADGDMRFNEVAGEWMWDAFHGPANIIAYRLSEQQSMEEAYEQTHKEIEDSALDVQVAGSHYKKLKIQPIEYAHANNLDCFQFNIVRYATRHKDKGGADDLRKLIHTAQLALEMQYGEKK